MKGIDLLLYLYWANKVNMKKKMKMMTAKKAGKVGPGAKAMGAKHVGKKAKNMK